MEKRKGLDEVLRRFEINNDVKSARDMVFYEKYVDNNEKALKEIENFKGESEDLKRLIKSGVLNHSPVLLLISKELKNGSYDYILNVLNDLGIDKSSYDKKIYF